MARMELVVLDPRIEEWGIPARGTDGSAGLDLRACVAERTVIAPQGTLKIGTGVAVHIADPGLVGLVVPRSSAGKRGVALMNTVGVIDSDYLGEIVCFTLNWNPPGGESLVVEPGDRLFQLLFVPVAIADLVKVSAFSTSTARGEGGYGSTGR